MEDDRKSTKIGVWDKTKSGIIITGAVLTMFSLFFGGFQYIDTTYAKDKQVIFLNHKVDVKILDDRINKLQNREWDLQDRLAIAPNGSANIPIIHRQINETTAEKNRLDAELKVVIGKYKQAEEDIKH
jgi:hypothetical protein